MTSREQTLAIVLISAILLTAGIGGGYMFIWQPYQKQKADEETLDKEIADLESQLESQRGVAKKLEVARVRSLPADEAMARREYTVALEHLAENAGIPKGYTITPRSVDNSARAVPEISKGKPIYSRVAYELVLKKVDMWMVKDFLEGYYKLGISHQITSINIKKEDDPGSKNAGRRNDLTVTLTTEAIIVDGAQNRHTLLPVPTAFAAIGGGAAYKALTVSPEAARGVVPETTVPVLSPANRDYSLIVQNDPFNGPLPPPPAFALAKISDVKVKPEEKPWPVKVGVSGDGSYGAKVTAVVSDKSTIFAPGELKVDPKTFSIELPRTSATEGSSTIDVVATSSDGKTTQKASFKVTVEPQTSTSRPEKKEDIAPYIVLIGVTHRSDGTAWARIFDNANRKRYQIDATAKEIKVAKEEIAIPRKGWTLVDEHKHPPGVMVISESNAETYRMFKVIAVDHDGLFLADLKPDAHAPVKRPGGPPGMGAWPPKGGGRVVGHAVAAIGHVIAPSPPKYYRWSVGQSLAGIKQIPDDEAKKILKQAEATGPLLDVAIVDR